jgi:hypothetical protein
MIFSTAFGYYLHTMVIVGCTRFGGGLSTSLGALEWGTGCFAVASYDTIHTNSPYELLCGTNFIQTSKYKQKPTRFPNNKYSQSRFSKVLMIKYRKIVYLLPSSYFRRSSIYLTPLIYVTKLAFLFFYPNIEHKHKKTHFPFFSPSSSFPTQ